MSLILFYDTETSGIPDWHKPSDAEHQPHVVQLAAQLVDDNPETGERKIVSTMDVIVRPNGWEIPDEVVAIHGITKEHAERVGIPESLAVEMLVELSNRADLRVGHAQSFDMRIIRIALKRFMDDELADEWKAGRSECTQRLATKSSGLGARSKLVDLYEHLFGERYEGTHSAMADVDATRRCYFELIDRAATEAA